MKATWFRDPDNTDCPELPYSIRLHRGADSEELTRCRTEDKARVVCSMINSICLNHGEWVGNATRSLESLFTDAIHAPDEIAGFHPICETN